MRALIPGIVGLVGLVAVQLACADTRTAAVDTSGAPEPASPRAAPTAWSDAQLLAFTRGASHMLAADAPTIEKRARSAALRSFARRVAFQHRQIAARADSLIHGVTKIPDAGMATIKRHEDAMKRLQQQRDFDIKYVKVIKETLMDVQRRLDAADTKPRGEPVTDLLVYSRTVARTEANNAARIEAALLERRLPPASGTKQ